jgi:hypothetical protein
MLDIKSKNTHSEYVILINLALLTMVKQSPFNVTLSCLVENQLFLATAVQLRRHVGAVRGRTFFSRLISKFFFDFCKFAFGTDLDLHTLAPHVYGPNSYFRESSRIACLVERLSKISKDPSAPCTG